MQQMWQMREAIALVMLAICTYTDIKERNIYLVPLAIASAGAAIMELVVFFAMTDPGAYQRLIMYLLLPLATGVLMIILSHSGFFPAGEGDGYLIAALTLVTGFTSSLHAVAAGSIMAALYALIKLVAKKKRSVPFAPFVMTGFILVIINEI